MLVTIIINQYLMNDDLSYQSLFQMIEHLCVIDDVDRQLIIENSCLLKLSKKEFLLKEGEVCEAIYFVVEGYVRNFAYEDIEEKTLYLAGKNEFISSFSSFLSGKKSVENLQTITDTTFIVITKAQLQTMYDTSHHLERVGRKIVEKLFVDKEERVNTFIKDSAEERYFNFLTQYPDYLLNIPLVYVASFLGIKPETLSRIRAKKIS